MTFKSMALAAALVAAPFAGQAATIVYQASGDALYDRSMDGSFTGADFFDDGTDAIDVAVSGSLSSGLLEGELLVSNFGLDDPDLLVGDTLVSYALGPVTDGLRTLTVLFGGLSGAQADLFGNFATAIFTFVDGDEVDGELDAVDVAISSDLSPVPLPASLPLLLVGLGTFAASRRKRT